MPFIWWVISHFQRQLSQSHALLSQGSNKKSSFLGTAFPSPLAITNSWVNHTRLIYPHTMLPSSAVANNDDEIMRVGGVFPFPFNEEIFNLYCNSVSTHIGLRLNPRFLVVKRHTSFHRLILPNNVYHYCYYYYFHFHLETTTMTLIKDSFVC